jgi:hypothetical protein
MSSLERVKVDVATPVGNQKKDGTVMEVKSSTEPWTVYELKDGTKIKVKQALIRVVKLDETDPLGNPIYITQAAAISLVDNP